MGFVDEMPTSKLDVPHEPGEWFEVRQLSWKELDQCRTEAGRRYLSRLRELGPEMVRTVAELEERAESDPATAAQIMEARAENDGAADREQFDKEALILKSVVGWSYERRFSTGALDKLDDRTSDWLYGAIANLYTGAEAESPKDSEPSTGTSMVLEDSLTNGS